MTQDKVEFLFGTPNPRLDPDGLESRSQLLQERFGKGVPAVAQALRDVVASLIADDDPPELWETSCRLRASRMHLAHAPRGGHRRSRLADPRSGAGVDTVHAHL